MTAQKPRRPRIGSAVAKTRLIPNKHLVLDRFQLLVHCRDEAEQRRVYEMLVARGHACRVLVS